MSLDPFGTAALRAAVVEAWRRSPARLREDANTEEDHARGYYRDRVVVELAQNAADAAARAGTPGRLVLRLTEVEGRPVLLAANTGSPLDAPGVAALATMRASAKRDSPGLVGRFGVGFAAVRAVADDVLVVTDTGAVRFSLERTRATLEAEPVLADELARRGDDLPVLRLPFAADDDALDSGVPDGGAPEDGAPDGGPSDGGGPEDGAPKDGAPEGDTPDPDPVLALARRALADFDTVLALELRDDDAVATVRSLLGQVTDPFLLALPALAEITIETADGAFTVADVGERWHVVRRSGIAGPALLADRPTEERELSTWQLAWALPHSGSQREGVVLAPTPTMEPLTLPALLIGTLPLDPTRRHVASGPLTDELVQEAGALYGELGVLLADEGRSPFDLVPTGMPAGELDARLRRSALDALVKAPVLEVGSRDSESDVQPLTRVERAAGLDGSATDQDEESIGLVEQSVGLGEQSGGLREQGGGFDEQSGDIARRVAPGEASVLTGAVGTEPGVVAVLGRAAVNLIVLRPGEESRAVALGVQVRTVGDVVDELGALPSPAHWRELYAALSSAAVDPTVRESLGAIGVPLVDGRTVRGARGTVVLRADREVRAAAEALAPWGLRIVHPDAEHPLLEQLGAEVADASRLVGHPAVHAAIDAAIDDDDVATDVASAVLTLAAAADDLPSWIADLPLPDADGGFAPARELVVPGIPAEELFDLDVVGLLAAEVAESWPDLHRVGVITGLGVRTIRDVVTGPTLLDTDDEALPDAWHDYLDDLTERLGSDVHLGDLDVVADLDAVRADAWPAALRGLDTESATHRAVTRPVRGLHSYTAWWLRHASPEHLGTGAAFALDPALEPLLGAPPEVLDGCSAAFQEALGGVHSLADLDLHDWPDVDLGEPGDTVEPATARAVWDALGAGPVTSRSDLERSSLDRSPLDRSALEHAPLEHVPLERSPLEAWPSDALLPAVVAPDRVALAPARDVVVVPGPHWFARADVGPMLPGPRDPEQRRELAARLGVSVVDDQEPDDDGAPGKVPEAVLALVPGAPATWREHEDLRVAGQPVDWWPPAHAVHVAGLARALAWSSGHWSRRAVVELALTEPERARELAVELAAEEDAAP